MPHAEVREVVDRGGATPGVIVVVVDLASVDRHATPGEPAVLVAGSQVSTHRLGRRVGIRRRHHAGVVEEQA